MTDSTKHTESLRYRTCEMRIMGHDYPTIADAFDLTPEGARELVSMELKERDALRDPETEYLLSVEKFRRLLDALKKKAEAGSKAAITETIKIIELWERMKEERTKQCTPKE